MNRTYENQTVSSIVEDLGYNFNTIVPDDDFFQPPSIISPGFIFHYPSDFENKKFSLELPQESLLLKEYEIIFASSNLDVLLFHFNNIQPPENVTIHFNAIKKGEIKKTPFIMPVL